jgi:hypothetical protein
MFFNRKLESGQALAEYVVTVPIGVAILIVSGLIVGFLTDSFQTTADGLTPSAYQCNEDDSSDEQHEGPRTAQLSCHTIELISEVYDANTDTTTVGYRVTSVCDPSISYWTLAIPSSVASKIQSASEQYSYGKDPTTGVTGVKFDTGYESGGGSGDNGGNGGNGGNGSNGNGNGRGKASLTDIVLVSSNHGTHNEEVRDVFLTLGGYFQWDITEVTVKAGQEVSYSTISAPSAPAEQGSENGTCEADE